MKSLMITKCSCYGYQNWNHNRVFLAKPSVAETPVLGASLDSFETHSCGLPVQDVSAGQKTELNQKPPFFPQNWTETNGPRKMWNRNNTNKVKWV